MESNQKTRRELPFLEIGTVVTVLAMIVAIMLPIFNHA